MSNAPTSDDVVRRLWQFCGILRDDGLSYPDYVEQLTYLLFLRFAEASDLEAVAAGSPSPWLSLVTADSGESAAARYSQVLESLGDLPGTLGTIFAGARSKISSPAKLRLLIQLIDEIDWASASRDVVGDAYEGLLEKNARDTKSGAGQYFTPRPLVDSIIRCIAPSPQEVVLDPACGTGGFLLSANSFVMSEARGAARRPSVRSKRLKGVELVSEVARLAAMNLYLHGVSSIDGGEEPISCADSLAAPTPATDLVDVIVTNPPFGVRGSVTYLPSGLGGRRSELDVSRDDFWVSTANKQLNFVQHIVGSLKSGGRAAIVLPDNVLFESGAAAMVRRGVMDRCDLHTILRLPRGLFYAQGVQANVVFLTRRAPSTDARMWIYDLRTGINLRFRTSPIEAEHLVEFERLFVGAASERAAAEGDFSRWSSRSRADVIADPDCRWDFGLAASGGRVSDDSTQGRLAQMAAEVAGLLESATLHMGSAAQLLLDSGGVDRSD